MKNVTSSVCRSNNGSSAFLRQPLYFGKQQKCSVGNYFIHRMLKRCVCKDQDLIKLKIFYSFFKNAFCTLAGVAQWIEC